MHQSQGEENILRNDHPDTITSHCNLALLYKSEERFREAEQYYIKALRIAEKSLGSKHSETQYVVKKLSQLYRRMKEYDNALSFYLRHLDFLLTQNDPNDESLSIQHWNIAVCLKKLDRYSEAIIHRQRCWEIECLHDGPDAPSTLQTVIALSEDYIASGDPENAMKIVLSALDALLQSTADNPKRGEWVERLTNQLIEIKSS